MIFRRQRSKVSIFFQYRINECFFKDALVFAATSFLLLYLIRQSKNKKQDKKIVCVGMPAGVCRADL